jgi:hypothetical protein
VIDVHDADTVIARGNVAIRFYLAPPMRAKESAATLTLRARDALGCAPDEWYNFAAHVP